MPTSPIRHRLQTALLALLLAAGCAAPTRTPAAPTLTPAPSSPPTVTNAPASPSAPAAPSPAAPADISGEWLAAESFPVDPAKSGYLRFTFQATDTTLTGRYALPLVNGSGTLDAPVLTGTQLTWQLNDRGRALTYAADLAAAGDTLSATASYNGVSLPVTLTRLAPASDLSTLLGWYAVDHEHLICLFSMDGDLYYRDFLTGRMSPLLPTGPDTYVGGPAWQVPAPVETQVTFTRTAGSPAVTGLLWDQAGQPTLSATRLTDFYTSADTRFNNGDVSLAGTLVTPNLPGAPDDARYPAIVSLHGSEPGRRRDTFRWMAAEWLAYYGLATLVYDKRGVGDSTGSYIERATDSNIQNLADDALAGVAWLKTQPHIDPAQIGALGASQAGWIGPRMAAASPAVAFLVMVVGPSVAPNAEDYLKSYLASHPRDSQAQTDPDFTAQVLSLSPSPFDPVPYIVSTTVPALWVYGGLDTHIAGYASAATIDRLIKDGQTNLTMQFYPEGNHSLFTSLTGFDDEMPYRPGFIPGWNAAELHWILEHVRVPGAAPAGQAISLTTADGVTLPGTQYGAGQAAVIFATTSDSRQDTWAATAQQVAQAGYLALTFDFRFWQPGAGRDIQLMNAADTDLRAAVDYARAQGAQRVVVIGASLGGLAAAKIAAAADLAGLVVLGAPLSDPALTIAVSPAELAAATMPKLIILSDADDTVSPDRTQALFDLAAEPKDLLTLHTSQHATALLTGPHAAELQAALLNFLHTHVPPTD